MDDNKFLFLLFLFLTNIKLISGQVVGSTVPLVVNGDPKTQFPELITADNFPLFPFTDQLNWGIELNPANKVAFASDLNIPVPGWGNFDLDGNLYTGHINTDTRVGMQVRPVNKLKIKPETLVLLGQNPAFRAARKKAKEVLIGKLPYNYEPLKCKPPYCNPFVQHTAVAVEFEEGDDTFFIGGIDFPMPIGPGGQGVRFPLSGAVEAGTSPYAYAHGEGGLFNNMIFELDKIDNVRKKAAARRKRSIFQRRMEHPRYRRSLPQPLFLTRKRSYYPPVIRTIYYA